MTAETRNAFAWPDNWRMDGAYRRTYRVLVFNYGPERATLIAAGMDEASNRDLWLWRNLGQPKPMRGSTP